MGKRPGGVGEGSGEDSGSARHSSRRQRMQQQVPRDHQNVGEERGGNDGSSAAAAAAAAAAAGSDSSDVVEIDAADDGDWELQQALALSLQEFQGAPPAANQSAEAERQQPGSGSAAAAEYEALAAKPASPRGPMRGKRLGQQQQQQQQQQQHAEPAAAQQLQQQPSLAQQPGADREPPPAAKPAPPTKPAAAKPVPPAAQQGKGRGRGRKKAPPFNPPADQVDAGFVLLAGGRAQATADDIIKAGAALGQALAPADVQNMLRYAAAHVLGWGSAAGRGSGAWGALGPDDFRRLVDHFRVE